MQHSKLYAHKFKKGRFITPFNEIGASMTDEESWSYGRLPEYIWIGLIFDYYGRKEAFHRLKQIVMLLKDRVTSLSTLRLSDIFSLKDELQVLVYEIVTRYIDKEVLAPLTTIFTLSKHRKFVEYFYNKKNVDIRIQKLKEVLKKLMDHQSYHATDVRYIVLVFLFQKGKLHVPRETIDLLNKYTSEEHSSDKMRTIRPTVRAIEMVALCSEIICKDYLCEFWNELSELTKCELYTIVYKKEGRDMRTYLKTLHDILLYYTALYENIKPLDQKMKVLIGIYTYSYKRFKEAVDHELFSTISGRGIIRIIIEDYIMMKYLCQIEKIDSDVWEKYEIYGIGQYKLILEKSRECCTNLKNSHFDEKYIETLVNEYMNEEFIDMDTRYFRGTSVREKAIKVNEKELFDLLYDYDSAFEHGLWGAIRESSFLKCDNPAHQYHCVPDCEDNIVMKSTANDCVNVLNRTILFLKDIYGIPESMEKEAIEFGNKFTTEQNTENTNGL